MLGSLLDGKTMNVNDMAAAALESGYKTGSKDFRSVIALTMLKHPKIFKRVSRGQYTAK